MRVAGDIRGLQSQSIHAGDDPVRCGLKTGILPGNPVGLAHVGHIQRVDTGVPSERADVLPPVFRRTYQSMQ